MGLPPKLVEFKSHFFQMVKNSGLWLYREISANLSLLTLKRSNCAHFGARGLFFARGHKSIIFLPYDCKHLSLVAKKKEQLVKLKTTEK